jgi:Ca2+-binding RTX toxin-like protein
MAKPFFTLSQIITQLQTQWDESGDTYTWAGATVSFSIPTNPADPPNDFGGGEAAGFDAGIMTPYKIAMAEKAFALWDDLIAISLNEVSTTNADITFAHSTLAGSSHSTPIASGAAPDYTFTNAPIWLNDTPASQPDSDVFIGGFRFTTYIHEIGHSLGLSHPGSYNVAADYTADAEYAQDTWQYTVMSYFDETNYDDANFFGSYPATPMLHDIAAIQAKYGADMTTRTGDTVYGFNRTADRDVFDFTVNTGPVVAIWDAGGNDTLDVSGFTSNQTIDLRSGFYSDIGGLIENVVIAYNCVIENAVGGSGDDLIVGNAGANQLTGGDGADILTGLDGNDTLFGGPGSDLIYGNAGDDVIVVRGNDAVDDIIRAGRTGEIAGDTLRVDFRVEGVSALILHNFNAAASSIEIWQGNHLWLDGTSGDDVINLSGLTGVSGLPWIEGLDWNDQITGTVFADDLRGLNGNDTLKGGDGADTLSGGAGNDRLDGGTDADFLAGGANDDIYYVDNPGDIVSELADEGYDRVFATLSCTLTDNVEQLTLHSMAGAIDGYGNELDLLRNLSLSTW